MDYAFVVVVAVVAVVVVSLVLAVLSNRAEESKNKKQKKEKKEKQPIATPRKKKGSKAPKTQVVFSYDGDEYEDEEKIC